MKNFKILIAGNMVNQGFVTAKELRKKGYNVDLLMEEKSHITADPAYLEPELRNNYPPWIKFFNKKKSKWKFEIIKIMKQYDLIHSWVEFSIFAQFSGKPFIANTQGSDFRELAKANSLKGFLLRRAYRKAKVIIFNQPDYLDLNSKILKEKGIFVPIIWDKKYWPLLENEEKSKQLTIFFPANLDWKLKGNDIFLQGYSEFVKKFENTKLILVKRGVDSEKTLELIKKFSIEKYCEIVNGPLNRIEMLKMYAKSDIIVDQFVIGSMGSIALESMIYKKPLITYVNNELHRKSYGSIPPLISAKNPSEIFEGLLKLKDKNERKRVGMKLNTWVKEHHSSEKISEQIGLVYNLIEKGLNTKSILNELKNNTQL